MAIEIVDFPINSMVIFHGKLLVHQRVCRFDYVKLFLAGELCVGLSDNILKNPLRTSSFIIIPTIWWR